MSAIPHLVGMVHLLPLPGSPGYGGAIGEITRTAVEDATALADCGFPALMIENFGDVPFFADAAPAETVAAMAVVVDAVRRATDLTIGVNVLRNDLLSALGIAAATDAAFVRVNVLTGIMYTDQGPIIGRAAEALRSRARLCPDVEIWADVLVKHATPPPGMDIGQAAADTVERGLADAIIVSGSGTGIEPGLDRLTAVKTNIPKETRLVIGSGANTSNLSQLTEVADTVIVGTALKIDSQAANRVDPIRGRQFVQAGTDCGLL
ncbi:MAG: BtpA/SgcQ family protein [Acidimicrobiia bacterium]